MKPGWKKFLGAMVPVAGVGMALKNRNSPKKRMQAAIDEYQSFIEGQPDRQQFVSPEYQGADFYAAPTDTTQATDMAKALQSQMGVTAPVDTRDASYGALDQRFSNVLSSIGEGGLRGGVQTASQAQAASQMYAPAAAAIENQYASQQADFDRQRMGLAQGFYGQLANEAARRTGFSVGQTGAQNAHNWQDALTGYQMNVVDPYAQDQANAAAIAQLKTGMAQGLMQRNAQLGSAGIQGITNLIKAGMGGAG